MQLKTLEERQSYMDVEAAKKEALYAETRAELAQLKGQILNDARGQAEEYARAAAPALTLTPLPTLTPTLTPTPTPTLS